MNVPNWVIQSAGGVVVLIVTLGVTWGATSSRIKALETKVQDVSFEAMKLRQEQLELTVAENKRALEAVTDLKRSYAVQSVILEAARKEQEAIKRRQEETLKKQNELQRQNSEILLILRGRNQPRTRGGATDIGPPKEN